MRLQKTNSFDIIAFIKRHTCDCEIIDRGPLLIASLPPTHTHGQLSQNIFVRGPSFQY